MIRLKEEPLFKVLNSYSELEELISTYNSKKYFVDIYEKNIYLPDDSINEVLEKIKRNNNIALLLDKENNIILELRILLLPIDISFKFLNEDENIYFDYHFHIGIKSLKDLSELTETNHTYLFRRIQNLTTNSIKNLIL